jgi:hypothetical protein
MFATEPPLLDLKVILSARKVIELLPEVLVRIIAINIVG